MTRSTPPRPKTQRLSPLQVGALKLLKHDYPRARHALRRAYASPNWQTRDAVVTGLGDMLDARVVQGDKPPALVLWLRWPAEQPWAASAEQPRPARLLQLQAVCLQPALWRPVNRAEQKTLHALRGAVYQLADILLTDKHYLVRFSAALTLSEMLDDDQRAIIQPQLRRAYTTESHDLLRDVLARFA